MQTLLLILACLFAGLALLVFVAERFGTSADGKATAGLQRWILPLVGLLLVISALDYFLAG
ncbi:MAG: hypothetical protein V2I82_02505 [Halieaceae bacterium]|nr:hypothetical protein [Halieaceae bacterium]